MTGRIRSVRWGVVSMFSTPAPFERRLADLNAIENLVIPDVGDLCSYPFRRLETSSRNAYLNLTNCTDGSENQEWNYLEPAQHAQSMGQYTPGKVGSRVARNLAAPTLRTEFFRNLLKLPFAFFGFRLASDRLFAQGCRTPASVSWRA